MNTYTKASLAVAALVVALSACSGKPEASTESGAADLQSHVTAAQSAETADGAVQRNYPSASEEAALKLDYPLFLAYGPDSARLTAFYPGSSKRPVSVKLEPNAAGYGLAAEGSQCTFPIAYELTSADGKPLASDEYKGQPITLEGWGADKGVSVLSVSMAEGAKNNFGCNLVVTKK